ncbi:MAG TPA: acetyl ornithine aminotransferase family protein [Phycisphaerae bacterium]|nr:acetyl ornithine aminotransferase family protein [Phycisphaerae bacterium]HPZ96801.1 acetyl ornithine aminotransferase family protein [Phycisphaerae bacterium]
MAVAYADKTALEPAPFIAVPPPGPHVRAAVARDHRVTSTSNTRPYPLAVRRAQGCVIEDLDGNRFLDFTAGIAVCSTGHCHPHVVEAIQRQSQQLIHMCGSDFYYEPMIELAEKLAALAPGNGAKRVLFTNSGTEAIEASMKLARHSTHRKWIIAFYGAFHGRSMGALSLTASKVRQKERFGPLVPMVAHADYGDVDSIEKTLFKREVPPDEVAAIFVEPILGEGGYIVPPDDFLPRLRELCTKHGILLVADEIQSGMGRTGRLFAVEHWGVEPDIICLAKGLASGMPLGAVIAGADVMQWPPGSQGSTFGGNPVSCAAALATLELIQEEYLENAARLGRVAMDRLHQMAEAHACIGQIRGRGLMIGVDFVRDRATRQPAPDLRDRIVEAAFKRGLATLGCGESAIRISPPLCITRSELETGLRVFEEAIAAAESERT